MSSQSSGHSSLLIGTKKDQNKAVVTNPASNGHFAPSAKKRHRRSFKLKIIKKHFIRKRNFPNNFLTNPSLELGLDDSNETENFDVDETNDHVQHETGSTKKVEETSNGHDEDVNESDASRVSQVIAPYWDSYDTVNQLYLEISEYTFACTNQ